MKIGIDMDEVIADLLSEYILFLNTEYDMNLTRERFNGYYTWDTCTQTIEEKFTLLDEFYKTEHFRNVKPIQDAVSVIHKLKSNHELYLITARPRHLESSTRSWIEHNFPEIFTGVYFVNHELNRKKSDICKELDIQLMIDDCLDYALQCAVVGVTLF